jgi:hypothetical protein
MNTRRDRQRRVDAGRNADRDRLRLGRDVEAGADDLKLPVTESALRRGFGGESEQG